MKSTLIKAVTFDFWNTLVSVIDYTNGRINFLVDVLKKEGISVEKESVRLAYYSSMNYFYDVWKHQQRYITPAQRTDLTLEKLNIKLNDLLKQDIKKEFEEIILRAPPPLIYDADRVLQILHRGYKIGLICDSGMSPGKVLRSVLEKHNILNLFHCTIFSDEVGRTKPDSLIFEKALEGLKLKAPEVIHVGDLLETDVAGAKAIGMKAIWFKREDSPQKNHLDILPDHEINNLSQLLNLLAVFNQ
jgi:putative hydrolase of the HAD superfamily